MHKRPLAAIAVAVLCLGVSACGGGTPVKETEYNDPRFKGQGNGVFGADTSLFSFGDKNRDSQDAGSGTLGVNAYLWRGALDTLSFMPLASADPFGGVIITDWYQPPAAVGERFKASAYILGRQLRADGIRISIFRQVAQNGQWVDAPVAPNTGTEIENKVLARARELRAASVGS